MNFCIRIARATIKSAESNEKSYLFTKTKETSIGLINAPFVKFAFVRGHCTTLKYLTLPVKLVTFDNSFG